jgi:hypothetical protein
VVGQEQTGMGMDLEDPSNKADHSTHILDDHIYVDNHNQQ